ncbi:MAG TPA: winged helix-turn-helix domain-containing protein [Gemmatimonadaceae bacterium]
MSEPCRFGPFHVDARAGKLRREGTIVPLQDLPFRLLTTLLERPGDVVTRAELTARLWGAETFVDSTAGLNTAVAKLREALGDQAEQPIYIETVPKRGYRFIGAIEPDLRVDAENAGTPPRFSMNKRVVWGAAALAIVGVVATGMLSLRGSRTQTRIAVVLFDNETGRPEVSRLSQSLTDATVFALTADPRLAVIGNAAVLRTERPFRDIALVRDTLHADFVVIGQVQVIDDRILVRSHLIRAADQAHVWVNVARLTNDEATLLSDVSSQIAKAVSARTGTK